VCKAIAVCICNVRLVLQLFNDDDRKHSVMDKPSLWTTIKSETTVTHSWTQHHVNCHAKGTISSYHSTNINDTATTTVTTKTLGFC